MTYELLKFIHIIGACVLFGTGIGIAFFMFWAVRQGDIQTIAGVSKIVVVADYLFTATAAALQPITGLMLVYLVGYSLDDLWVWGSLVLYVLIGVCWIPVVFMQKQMRDLALNSIEMSQPLSDHFNILYRRWFLLGWPAFIMMMLIFWLMIAKPV